MTVQGIGKPMFEDTHKNIIFIEQLIKERVLW